MKRVKKSPKQYVDKNPIEQLLGIGGGVVQGGADLGKRITDSNNWNEILGITDPKEKQRKYQGELIEGQELNLKDLQEENSPSGEERKEIEPSIDYAREIVHVAEQAINRENQELEAQLREIMSEIKKLADSSKELQMQFKEVAVEQRAVKAGKYHKSFFSWLLSVISSARIKVEDSGAWLAALQSKKKFREYGAMAKKYGTTFSLSNERVVATQVG